MKIPCYSVLEHVRVDGGYLVFDTEGVLMMRSDVEKELARLQAVLTVTQQALTSKTKTIRKLRNALAEEEL